MKRLICLLIGLVSLAGLLPGPVAAARNPVPKATQAVVCIASGIDYAQGRPYMLDESYGYATGTGFGVGRTGEDAQIFLTNCHVVSKTTGKTRTPYDHVFIFVDGADIMDESTVIRCEVIYADPEVDLAIVRTEKPIAGVATLPIVSGENVVPGETVYALGFPGIADKVADSNHYTVQDITVTDGVASRHLVHDGIRCLAHTASVNHGNSGGPLINEEGQVVGINTFIFTDSGTADRRNYAIYADYIMEAMDELGLPYVNGSRSSLTPVLICVGAGVLAAVLAGIFLMRRKRSGKKPETKAVLRALRGPLAGQSWPLMQELTIGRDPRQSIVLPEDTKGVSRSHCAIHLQGDTAVITDRNSTYGTFLNGQKLTPGTSTVLAPNTVISLASDSIQFVVTFE